MSVKYDAQSIMNTGFVFPCRNKRLGSSRLISKRDIPYGKANDDDVPLVVWCKDCQTFMDFKSGVSGPMAGSYTCPSCYATVKERALYQKMMKENQRDLKWFDED